MIPDDLIPEFAEPPAESSPGPFAGRSDGDVLRLALVDGRTFEGSLMLVGGMRFLHVREGGMTGRTEGPFTAGDVARLTVLRTVAEVRAERLERRMGEPVPGTVRRTRDGYEARLELLARLVAVTGDRRRRDQIECQFDALADEIALAKTKRTWMLAAARWARHSNAEPTKLDFSGGDMTMAERFQRPRPQDFDPDPAVRRKRPVRPPHVASDPRSTYNMLSALRRAGFKARVSVIGEITDDRADLLVDFPGGKGEGRFLALGARRTDGRMEWRQMWDGNGTRTDETRRQRSLRRPEYRTFLGVLAEGLRRPVPAAAPARPEEPETEPVGPAL